MLIICGGMVRSGSTLQYNIARLLVEKMNRGVGEGYFLPENLQTVSVKENFYSWCNDDKMHIIKTHDAVVVKNMLEPVRMPETIKILYTYRDVRDVCVSLMRKESCSFTAASEKIDEALQVYYGLLGKPDVFVQKYEDMIYEIHAVSKKMADFVCLNPDELIINEIVNACSIDAAERLMAENRKKRPFFVKNILRSMGIPLPSVIRAMFKDYDKTSLLHYDHISAERGAVGVWKNALKKKEIEKLNIRYAKWLAENGYM